LGPVVGFPARNAIEKIKAELGPVFSRRSALVGVTEKQSDSEPLDHLQMMLRFASQERPAELNLDVISKRVALANLASMPQTSIQATNLILNAVSSNNEHGTISALRDELRDVFGSSPTAKQNWTRNNVSALVRADSVCRETLRLHSVGNRSLLRRVLATDLKTEDGIPLPRGSTTSVLSYPAHHNEDLFPSPEEFDPFRFSKTSGPSLVTTGPQFLPFGHGKAACPGRFLVDVELKMVLAYLVLNYEIRLAEKYGGVRPANRWVSEVTLPPAGIQIEVKRREKGGP
jgi:cytochrome P450